MKIGYLGPQGTFSQAALKQHWPTQDNITEVPYVTMPLLMQAVEAQEIDAGIVPIENSLEGPINIILDQLAFNRNLFIQSEVICPVTENLIVRPGTPLHEIRHITSHPQPIGQCSRWIQTHLPVADIAYANSTADGALAVQQGKYDAVIGSELLAEIYNLEIRCQRIEDNPNNSTRFVIVGTKPRIEITGNDKTSIVFSVDNRPGRLYQILDIFNLWDINMSKIESRPSKQCLGEYIFFVDLVGHISDHDMADALKMIQRKSSFYKFLGSYPAAAHPSQITP